MTNIKIERITSADSSTAEAISLLLKQLSSQEFSFSERELSALINDPSSSLFLLFAEDKIAGMLTLGTYLSPTGRKAWVEDVVVDSTYRGKGYGKQLMRHLARVAKQEGCGRFEWSVLDWNEPAIGFYESLGATVMLDWRICRLTGEALDRFAGNEGSK